MTYFWAANLILLAFLLGRWHEQQRVQEMAGEFMKGLILSYMGKVRHVLTAEDVGDLTPEKMGEILSEVEDEIREMKFKMKVGPASAVDP